MEPRIVANGQTGERVVFGDYGSDGDGEYLVFDEVSLPADSAGPPEHRHLLGDERIEVVDGRLGIRVDDEEHVLEAGEATTVPKGARHTWWNAGDTTVVTGGELRDPGRFEEALTTFFALVNDGKVDARGRPGLLQASVWLAEYRHEYGPSFLPAPAKWIAFHLLAPLGRALGYRPVHEYVEPGDAVTGGPVDANGGAVESNG